MDVFIILMCELVYLRDEIWMYKQIMHIDFTSPDLPFEILAKTVTNLAF